MSRMVRGLMLVDLMTLPARAGLSSPLISR
jgi:hypothetical protein